ncbi:CocE/NonD family hydrolase [Streptomyces sp. NBC_01278]|uniref:CocE/NonD family hydrolase n=1 Tax=Streptomyces sp. NBC_01278 TaxID=2903809 RepID=UPI002E2F1390|nr:CocE/NonD family hydrolase [Streptomyces sp. NBC_01278]
MRTMKNEWITASDGARICADVYLPEGDGPFPALYAVAPYQKDLLYLPAVPMFRFIETGPLDYWTGHGYAVVVGDQRGTGRSEGQFELFGPAEQRDFYDTIEWIASRFWSTGKVSMIGESAYSVNQWLAAAQRPPHLTCTLIYSGFTDAYHDAVYHGGVYSMGFLNFWSTDNLRAGATIGGGTPPRPGGITADLIGMTLDRPVFDDWWEQRAVKVEDIDVPVLNIAWWYSVGLHLRVDNGVMDGPAVRIQVANSGRQPREEAEWPPRRAVPITLYLDPEPAHAVISLNDGSLATTPPTGPAATATVYDYPNPEWTVGTTVITDGIPQPTRGILTFTTPPLEHDTDFHVKISEQQAVPKLKEILMRRIAKNVPPPSAMVTRGWLKASHRTQPPQPIEPGTVGRYEIEVWPTSYLFPKGSRIRLEIAKDGAIHWSRLRGTTWTSEGALPGHRTRSNIGLAVFDGKLMCVHRDPARQQLWWSAFDGAGWSTDTAMPGHSSKYGPALAVHRDRTGTRDQLLCVHRGHAQRFVTETGELLTDEDPAGLHELDDPGSAAD